MISLSFCLYNSSEAALYMPHAAQLQILGSVSAFINDTTVLFPRPCSGGAMESTHPRLSGLVFHASTKEPSLLADSGGSYKRNI